MMKLLMFFSIFILQSFVTCSAFAEKYPTRITGEDAEFFYILADAPDEYQSDSEPRVLSCGCHYTKEDNQFNLAYCDFGDGFINAPLRNILSQILLSNRTPKFMEFDRYAIGVTYKCVKIPEYSCEFEDLKN